MPDSNTIGLMAFFAVVGIVFIVPLLQVLFGRKPRG